MVLEGIDGCGKTTQQQALGQWLRDPANGCLAPGRQLILTREPGGTPLGDALRALLLHPPSEAAPVAMAELLLYAADRAQHVDTTIRPALAAGHWVLSDRFSGSTAAYQGYGRGLDLARIAQLEQLATGGLCPDLTLWLNLPAAAAAVRRQGDGRGADRMEASGQPFLERVAAGFAALARDRDWYEIDACQLPAGVMEACTQALRRLVQTPPAPSP